MVVSDIDNLKRNYECDQNKSIKCYLNHLDIYFKKSNPLNSIDAPQDATVATFVHQPKNVLELISEMSTLMVTNIMKRTAGKTYVRIQTCSRGT